MALIAPMAAAGFAPSTIAATEAVSWLGVPAAYYAYNRYRGSRVNNRMSPPHMHGRNSKRPFSAVAPSGDYRKSKGFKKRGHKHKLYRPLVDRGQYQRTHWTTLQSILTIDINSGSDFFGQAKLQDITSAAAWSRLSNLYDLYRVHSMQIKVFSTDNLLAMLTFPSYDDVTPITNRDVFLRNSQLYTHALGRDQTCSRTIAMSANPKFNQFLKFASSTADLVSGSQYDASIKFCILTCGPAGQPVNNQAQKLQIFVKWNIQVASEQADYTVS